MKWSILAVSGTTFDSDLRPECDDKRPWPIMDEAAFRKVRIQAPHPSHRRSRHSAGQRVSAEPQPRGWETVKPQWQTARLFRVRGHCRGQGPLGLGHPCR